MRDSWKVVRLLWWVESSPSQFTDPFTMFTISSPVSPPPPLSLSRSLALSLSLSLSLAFVLSFLLCRYVLLLSCLHQAEKKEHLYKVLVIGDLGTGKTSIIKRYVHQFFSVHYRATVSLIRLFLCLLKLFQSAALSLLLE